MAGSTLRDKGRLPNLIVIGAMKAGTTSLHYYLGLHPEIFMSREKELQFFVEEKNWPRGLPWYRRQFRSKKTILGESSPPYTNYPIYREVPERMHQILPWARLIYVVRDPIERILSHYVHLRTTGRERRPFEEAVTLYGKDNPYIMRSRYHMQLARYFRYYLHSRILVFTAEALHRNRRATLKSVFRFLGVRTDFNSPGFSAVLHPSSRRRKPTLLGRRLERSPMMKRIGTLNPRLRDNLNKLILFPFSRRIEKPSPSAELRACLESWLERDVARLRETTGLSLAGWTNRTGWR